MAEFGYFRVSSDDPFERGRQLGAAAAAQVAGSVDVYRETFSHHTGLEWSDIRERAAAFRQPIADYSEAILSEIEGIAAGARLPVEDVLALNARTEIMFGLAVTAPPECTAFYVGPSASADGHVLLGQNWDWRARCSGTTILAEVEQGERPAFMMLAEAGLIGKIGFNSAGVGVATNALVADLDGGEPGVPYHVVLRGILNASTVEEAVSAIVRARRAASANYVVASAEGYGVDVETGPGGVETVFLAHPRNDVLGHSNHFCCAVPFRDTGAEKWLDSPGRIDAMNGLLERHHGKLTRTSLQEILKDHERYPDSVCRHPNEELHPIEQATSVASIVIDLTERVASVAAGTPCTADYATVAPAFAGASVHK